MDLYYTVTSLIFKDGSVVEVWESEEHPLKQQIEACDFKLFYYQLNILLVAIKQRYHLHPL